MKSVFDPSFKYTPSFQTDVRKTFERIRREQQAQNTQEQHAQVLGVAPVTKLILPAQRRRPAKT
jgi:hypothetical protein